MRRKIAALLVISLIVTSISYPIEIGNMGQMIVMAEENASAKKNCDSSEIVNEEGIEEKKASKSQIAEATADNSTKESEDIEKAEYEENESENLVGNEFATDSVAEKENVINEIPVLLAENLLEEENIFEIEDANIALKYTIDEDGVIITGWQFLEGFEEGVILEIPEIIDDRYVVAIGDGAFQNNLYLEEVELPDSIKSIGASAFYYCIRLQKIILQDSVTNIGVQAFRDCDRLTQIVLPNSVTSLGEAAFYDCDNLAEIVLSDSITAIENNVFYKCKNLSKITWPDSLASIGDYAFYWCESLAEITLPNSLKSIGNGTFADCIGLIEITIPDTVQAIGDSAFAVCYNLTEITLPNSLTSIGDEAFYHCNKIEEIVFPNSVTTMGDGVFNGCTLLAKITLPNTIINIGDKTFYECTSLENIVLPNSITTIGERAFYKCTNLTEITIPRAIEYIRIWAFGYCGNLVNVYYTGGTEDWKQIEIEDYNADLTGATIHYNVYGKEFNKTVWNGHTYQLYFGLDWESAKSYCESQGGYLASITSQEENDFLFNYVSQNGIGDAYFGFTDAEQEREWKWVNGEAADYTAWADGEPSGQTEENYAMFHGSSAWNDGSGERNYYICEWDKGTTGLDFKLGLDNFNFVNSPRDFLTEKELQKWFIEKKWEYIDFCNWPLLFENVTYQISDEAFNRLTEGMSNTVKANLKKKRKSKWGGSCYGLSTVMAIRFADPDRIPVAMIDNLSGDEENIYCLPAPNTSDEVESMVNYYHLMYEYPYFTKYSSNCLQTSVQNDYMGIVKDLISSITDDEVPTVAAIGVDKKEGLSAHAVILLGVEEETNDYYKVKVYDPNNKDTFENMYIYKTARKSEDEYYFKNAIHISYHSSLTSESQEREYTCLYNYFTMLEVMDMRNYFNSDYDIPDIQNYYTNPFIGISTNVTMKLTDRNGNPIIFNNQVTGKQHIAGPYPELSSLDGDGSVRELQYIFEQLSDQCMFELSSDNGAVNFSITFPEWSIMISAEENISVDLNQTEEAVVINGGDSGNISVLYTQNDWEIDWPWENIAVSVEDAQSLKISSSNEGVIIESDVLENAVITGMNDDNFNSTYVNMDADSVIVSNENVNNSDQLTVKDHGMESSGESTGSEENTDGSGNTDSEEKPGSGNSGNASSGGNHSGSSHSSGGSSNGGSHYFTGGSVSAGGSGSETGMLSMDPKKGRVNSLTGIITGMEQGFSRWIQDEHGWKLLYADNTYASGTTLQGDDGQPYEQILWELVNGSWYAFGVDGYLKTGFLYDYLLAGWFYVDVNTGMSVGWQLIDSVWYYFNPVSDGTKGKMAVDTWIDDYYVNKEGVWEENEIQ